MRSKSPVRFLFLFLIISLALLTAVLARPTRPLAAQTGPAQAGAVLLFDHFDQASLNTAVWDLWRGAYQIKNSVITLSKGADLYGQEPFANTDHVLEMRVRISDPTHMTAWWGLEPYNKNTEQGPHFRWSSSDNKLRVCSEANGLYDYYDCTAVTSVDVRAWHIYQIVMRGQTARLSVDGRLIHEGQNPDCLRDFSGCMPFAGLYEVTGNARTIDIDYIGYYKGSAPPVSTPSKTPTVPPPSPTPTITPTATPATSPSCYLLDLQRQPENGGRIDAAPPPNCGNKYMQDTIVTLTAQEMSGFHFHQWRGDLSGSANPQQVRMDGDKSVTAEFQDDGDPLTFWQWALKKIKIAQAWEQTRGADDVVIAVIDTGVDYGHEELAGDKTLTEQDRDFVNDDDDARDDEGHGTHVAGIAAANTDNGVGMAGVCPLCRILPLKVLNAAGSGSATNVARAIRYAADQGADVINLSLGSRSCADELADAVNYAYERDVVIVAAAGNACAVSVALGQETFEVNYPARFERVIAVGASDILDFRAHFSSYGPELDLTAPGVAIISAYPHNRYLPLDGTSMAAPHVAGVAGLLAAKDNALSPAQIQHILERTAKDLGRAGRDDKTGWGRLDAAAALAAPPSSVPAAPSAACPAEPLSVAAPSAEAALVAQYARLRDEVLLPSAAGQSYVVLYEEYGPSLAAILLTNPALLNRTAQFLKHAEDEFSSLLPDATGQSTLSQSLYEEADALVQDLAQEGDEQFRTIMLQTWADLALDTHIDQPTTLIWQEVQKLEVYLPMTGG